MRRSISLLTLALAMVALGACGPQVAAPTPTTQPAIVDATPTAAVMEDTPTPFPEETPTEVAEETPTTEAEASPAAGNDTSLSAVRSRGKLIAGVKFDIPVFGYLNPETNQNEGFDVEMARAVAERIFGSPDAVEFKEAISRNRIPYLEEGVVDVIFSTMTANEERAQQIDFSDCYYVAGQSILVPANSDITDVNSLAGKTVGTAKGSTSEQNIRKFAPQANVELFDGYAEAVQAMLSGRLDAVTTDDIILYGFQRRDPNNLKVVGGQFTKEPYAAGVKKGNTELLNEVNATIRDLKESGRWAEIYRKWISEDVPDMPPQDWREVTSP
jgi:putative glutamine transport system substrate-binding protein